MGDVFSEFKNLLSKHNKNGVPIQTKWAVVKSVDVSAGTMVAIVDDLEYYDILIGLGSVLTVPKVDTRCLIGIIENKHGAFLIDARDIEKIIFNKGDFGGLVISQEVASQINELKSDLNQLKSLISNWVVSPSDGGAALRSLLTSWSNSQLKAVEKTQLESKQITHG